MGGAVPLPTCTEVTMPSGIYIRKPRTEEIKRKISETLRGLKRPEEFKKAMREAHLIYNFGFQKGSKVNLGRHHTKETKEKLRFANLGKCISEENKLKLKLANIGNKYAVGNKNNLGKKRSEESKEKNRLSHLGKKASEETKQKMSEIRKGFKFSEESKEKMRLAQLGEKSHSWKGGVSLEESLLRNDGEYKQWTKAIYKRDKWVCQKCGYKGSNLNAHHLKSFTKYIELRYDLDNGITLCKDCHKQIHKRKILIA